MGVLRALVVAVTIGLAGCMGGYAPQGPPAATDLGFLGCQVGPQPGASVREGDPIAPGEPLGDLSSARIARMTPVEVGDAARARGLWVTWRYSYAVGPAPAPGEGAAGFSECWCVPPPDGRVVGLAYGIASEVVVFVDSGARLPAPRDQPARGWGCR